MLAELLRQEAYQLSVSVIVIDYDLINELEMKMSMIWQPSSWTSPDRRGYLVSSNTDADHAKRILALTFRMKQKF